MAAQDNLNPALFAKLKAKADATGKAQRAPGTNVYVPASKASKDKRKQKTRDFHSALNPMKETLRSSGMAFSQLSGHLKTNGRRIGAPESKRAALLWAADLHDRDPDNFIKNIGLK